MRAFVFALVSISLFAALASGAGRPEAEWVVRAPADLDGRIELQLNALAAQEQASIRIVKGSAATSQTTAGPGGLTIELRQENIETLLEDLEHAAGPTAVAPTAELAGEGYVIKANYPAAAAPNRLLITAASARGFHNALLRVPDLLKLAPSQLSGSLIPHPQAIRVEGNGLAATMADFPSFAERGVVEGFYGTPWSHQDRLNVLRFEGAHGMNAYYYAPKDDPYHRRLWREPYPPEGQKRLGELVETANRNFVDFCFAISPGLSMAYSSDRDFEALANKLQSVGKLGVSCFALFLDDVPQDLQDARDRAQFKTLAQAHGYLTNKLNRYLKAQSAANRLTLTPTTYTNEWGNRDYIKELGAAVDPGVPIVWTGPKVYSAAITAEQAREWGGYIGRPPLIWDNFPVNDGAPWSRYLGPLVGRDARLPGLVHGLVSNPMVEPLASLIPLETVADYLWNAALYDPAQSEIHAVSSQYGPDAPRQLAPFLKTYGSYYWEDGNFMALFKQRRYAIDVPRMQAELREMNLALDQLRGQSRFEPLLAEITPAVKRAGERLAQVSGDPAFEHRADGTLQWDENFDTLSAYHLSQSPKLDGDFSKWENGHVYRLDGRAQVLKGATSWQGPHQLSARVALAWDADNLYAGVDVKNPGFYQPCFARGIENGDAFVLWLETGFRKNFLAQQPTGGEYELYFSPGNFAGVRPSIFSVEDYLPPRPEPHNYMEEIRTAWRKTAGGYSGDIAIPVSFFDGGKFSPGYEMGLAFSVVKVLRPGGCREEDAPAQIILHSKKDGLFHITTNNPSSFPRLVLTE